MDAAIRSLLVASFVTAAALCTDVVLRRLRLPTRLVWLLAAGAIPMLTLWPPHFKHSMPLVNVVTEAMSVPVPVSHGWVWPACSLLAAGWISSAALRLHRLTRHRPTLRVTGRAVIATHDLGPAVIGVWAPRIVVPGWFSQMPLRAQRLVLIHELSHLKARDPWVLGATLLATLSMPWNPLLWWIVGRVRRAIELDCDARVLSRGIPIRRYGELLIEVAARPFSSLGPAAVICSTSDFLERRIRTMSNRYRTLHLLPTLALATVALMAAGGAVLASAPAEDTERAAKLEAEAAATQAAASQAVETAQADQEAKRAAEAAIASKQAAEAAELEARKQATAAAIQEEQAKKLQAERSAAH